jgi:Rad3-related DNA helicase
LESNFYGKELTVEQYSGKVGCPSTNNGVVLIERDGLVSWSGNCHAYNIGTYLADKLSSTERVLFCPDAKSRNTVLREHKNNSKPTVIISPSITEGYSFDYDLARFQIIVKMPFPYIGDRRVAIKMETDKDWYMLRTIMTIVQAAGRIVRDYEDSGVTYILDSDFYRIYKQYAKFFPAWFLEALQFHGQTGA